VLPDAPQGNTYLFAMFADFHSASALALLSSQVDGLFAPEQGREVMMASALNPTQHEFTEDLWPTEPPVGARIRSLDLEGKPSLGKRASRRLIRFLIVFGAGVAATLVWQSHGD